MKHHFKIGQVKRLRAVYIGLTQWISFCGCILAKLAVKTDSLIKLFYLEQVLTDRIEEVLDNL